MTTKKKVTEDLSECRPNKTLCSILTSRSDQKKKKHIPVFVKIQKYRKIMQNVQNAENLLQTSDMVYASIFNIEITDSSIYIKEPS